LGTAQPTLFNMIVLANTITADMGMIPGLGFLGPAMGLPLSVLAAVVERPFYTLAGVRRNTIWYSLQANLVSLGVGFVGTLVAAPMGDAMYTVWPFLAVAVSIVVERNYLQRRVSPNVVIWEWTILGNMLSAALCVAILYFIVYLRNAYPAWDHRMRPYAPTIQVITFFGCAAAFAYSFLWPKAKATADPSSSVL